MIEYWKPLTIGLVVGILGVIAGFELRFIAALGTGVTLVVLWIDSELKEMRNTLEKINDKLHENDKYEHDFD